MSLGVRHLIVGLGLFLAGTVFADTPANAPPSASGLKSTFDASVRSLQYCRERYASATPVVPGRCYADSLITLLAQHPDLFGARAVEALSVYLAARPTVTADTAARHHLLWQATPAGADLMHRISDAQSQAAFIVNARQAAAARDNAGSTVLLAPNMTSPVPPDWVSAYVTAENGVSTAFGFTPELTTDLSVRQRSPELPPLELSAAGARYQRWQRLRPSLDQFFNALPKGSVYLEFVDYRSLADPTRTGIDGYDPFRPTGEERYFAFASWKDGANIRASTADLGKVADIDARIHALRLQLMKAQPLADLPKQLYRSLLGPFSAALAHAPNLVISTAGTLNVLPFEVLQRDDGSYASDQAIILYGNARDLLADDLMAAWQRKLPTTLGVIFANPAYDASAAPSATKARDCSVGKQRGLQLTGSTSPPPAFPPHFSDLPCTQPEAEVISKLSPTRVDLLTGSAATETELRRRERPEFLHFATHGFLLPPPAVARAPGQRGLTYEELSNAPPALRLLVDPLYAAGIALAGANGGPRDPKTRLAFDDGIVSAAEVQDLNLTGTKLVVMSACETGEGLPGAGRAFYGLRHAFRSAGAAAVVGSLWSVNDETTAWFMSAFYAHFFAGDAPAVALQRARIEVRGKCPECKHPFYWAPFVMEGSSAALFPRSQPRSP